MDFDGIMSTATWDEEVRDWGREDSEEVDI
jgi:hypothetical protein